MGIRWVECEAHPVHQVGIRWASGGWSVRLILCIRWVECEAHPVHQVGGVCIRWVGCASGGWVCIRWVGVHQVGGVYIRWVECEGLNKIHVISSAESLVARVLSRWLLGC